MTLYLYGLPGAEEMEDDPDEVYEAWADDADPDRRPDVLVIEEWTAHPAGAVALPSAETLIERVLDWYVFESDLTEDGVELLAYVGRRDDVVAALAAALQVWTDACPYRQAERKVRDLHVTWDEDGSPLLDGRPMTVRHPEIPGQEALDV